MPYKPALSSIKLMDNICCVVKKVCIVVIMITTIYLCGCGFFYLNSLENTKKTVNIISIIHDIVTRQKKIDMWTTLRITKELDQNYTGITISHTNGKIKTPFNNSVLVYSDGRNSVLVIILDLKNKECRFIVDEYLSRKKLVNTELLVNNLSISLRNITKTLVNNESLCNYNNKNIIVFKINTKNLS